MLCERDRAPVLGWSVNISRVLESSPIPTSWSRYLREDKPPARTIDQGSSFRRVGALWSAFRTAAHR